MNRLPAMILALAAAALPGCGQATGDDGPSPTSRGQAPPDIPGTTRVEVGAFSFLAPADWQPERRGEPPGQVLAAYTGPGMEGGVTPQVGLGAGSEYPNSLEQAVELSKADANARYPEYQILDEGPVEVPGASAYRVDSTYRGFTREPVTIRMVTVLLQTPDRAQANLFVRAAQPDFDRLHLERLATAVRAR